MSEKAIRKLVGASTPAESAQLAFTGMTTAAVGAPPAAGVPSAKSTDDDADGSAPSAKDRAGDPISAAATDAEPVPMSLDRDASDRSFDRQSGSTRTPIPAQGGQQSGDCKRICGDRRRVEGARA